MWDCLRIPGSVPSEHESRRAFVIAHGKDYTASRLPRALRRRKPGTCFEACAKFVSSQKRPDEFQYVEGFAMRPRIGLAIPHAWLTRDGEAFDITWHDFSGGENLDCLYLGVEFTASAVEMVLLERGYYGLLDPVDELVLSNFEVRLAA